MANILIDGYNIMAKMDGLSGSLEARREMFIRRLGDYRTQKSHDITVVFDGEKGGWITESHERKQGINIVYSRLGEKADDVIKRMVKAHDVEYTVITSDKEIASYAENYGHTAILSEEFIPKLYLNNQIKSAKGDDEDIEYGIITTRKKGNPKRLSKAARRRRQRLDRL